MTFVKGNTINLGKKRPDMLGNKFCLGIPPSNKGTKVPYQPRPHMKGRIPWNKAPVLVKECPSCRIEFVAKRSTQKNCSRKCLDTSYMKGVKNWKYLTDRTQLMKKQERNDSAYKEWRRQVWLRDSFVCKIANPDCLGRIEAHHILNWSSHPELRYQVNNGITLCHAHHPRKRAEEKRLSPYFMELVSVSK